MAGSDRTGGEAQKVGSADPAPTFRELSAWADRLDADADFRVLRRLRPRAGVTGPLPPGSRIGLMVDVETTGLDPTTDEVIELAIVPFVYSVAGDVLGVMEPFQGFAEPAGAIPAAISSLTGITDEMVAGRSIDDGEVSAHVSTAALVLAHNAAFDRPFVERRWPSFRGKPWGCTQTQIDWRAEGADGSRLSHLLGRLGLFHDGHRAVDDCHAAIELLAGRLSSGDTGMASLLRTARRPTWRIDAVGAPFDAKERLRGRGYRWNAADRGGPRCWWREVAEDARDEEIGWLRGEVYGWSAEIPARSIDAYARFAGRA